MSFSETRYAYPNLTENTPVKKMRQVKDIGIILMENKCGCWKWKEYFID
jgi:hypothetical protein